MTDDDDERLSPWLWPARWFRDEAYWRQVSASTAAALIAGAASFLVVHSRLFADIPWFVSVGLTAVGAIASLAALYGLWRISDRRKRRMLQKLRNQLKYYEQDYPKSRIETKKLSRAEIGAAAVRLRIAQIEASRKRSR